MPDVGVRDSLDFAGAGADGCRMYRYFLTKMSELPAFAASIHLSRTSPSSRMLQARRTPCYAPLYRSKQLLPAETIGLGLLISSTGSSTHPVSLDARVSSLSQTHCRFQAVFPSIALLLASSMRRRPGCCSRGCVLPTALAQASPSSVYSAPSTHLPHDPGGAALYTYSA